MCLPKKVEAATIQKLATIVGNLLCLNFGLMFGITPAHMELYQSAETPLNRPIEHNEAAWISAYLFLCVAIGSLACGLISAKIGPKSVLLLGGLLQISSWFVIHFGFDIVHIHASRATAGIAAGAAFTVLPIFINEIAEEPNRSALLASIDIWRTFGILVGFILGAYLKYDYVNIVGICVSFIFTMTFPFVQESPLYYKRKGNVASLEKSLRWFRGIRDIDDRAKPEFVRELNEFKGDLTNDKKNGGVSQLQQPILEAPMPRKYLLHLIVTCVILVLGAQLSGIFVILNYAEEVFAEFKLNLTVEQAVLVLAAMQYFGAIAASWLGEKINRRILLSISAFICGLSLCALAVFISYGSTWHINPLYAPWLPLGLLSLHLFVANIGLFPLASMIKSELLPLKLRTILSSASTSLSWLIAFLLIKFFYPITAVIGLVGCYYVFAGFSIFVAAYALTFLPETRGRSLDDVQYGMGYVANGSVAKVTDVKNGHINNSYI